MEYKENIKSKTKKAQSESIILAGLVLILITLLIAFTSALPTGPNSINIISNTTGVSTGAKMVNISGGYIAKMNLTITSQNPRWKAFVGYIDGKFTLDDASGSTIYDWNAAITSGEVYATRSSTAVDWGSSSIRCATAGEVTAEDIALSHTGQDNITSTFAGTFLGSAFIVAGTTILGDGSCISTNTYVNNVTSTDFDEILLYDSTNSNIVYTTILEDAVGGYDGSDYDFQMIIPENGSATWTGSTAYYLYVELG